MFEKRVGSLSELEHEIDQLREMIIQDHKKYCDLPSLGTILFRGHSDHSWNLKTTLERYTNNVFTEGSYGSILACIQPAVNSQIERQILLGDVNKMNSDSYFACPSHYEFMVYARHHGFPSPLLDWTKSLYVALFFAYQKADVNDVALMAYIPSLKGGSGGWVGEPRINVLSTIVDSHARHFVQQGTYTVSVKHDANKNWVYCDHNEAIELSDNRYENIVYKFILPVELKKSILKKLYEMNITPFTLYGGEDALMETMALKELYLSDNLW